MISMTLYIMFVYHIFARGHEVAESLIPLVACICFWIAYISELRLRSKYDDKIEKLEHHVDFLKSWLFKHPSKTHKEDSENE